jgi:hypothetical protein
MLRRIDRFVDLSGVRAHLEPYYSDVGRPSIDPELMMRILLVRRRVLAFSAKGECPLSTPVLAVYASEPDVPSEQRRRWTERQQWAQRGQSIICQGRKRSNDGAGRGPEHARSGSAP